MRNRLRTQNYEEIFCELSKAKEWIESIGLSTENSRFSSILNNIDIARRHFDQPNLKEVLEIHPVQELLMSLLDSDAFVTIHEQFRKLKNHQLPRGRIKVALGGPIMPHDEKQDGATIQARNALFELELASRLQARGVNLTSFEDIEFEFEGTHVNVQCKRPRSALKLQDNIDKACSQISNKISGTKKRGVIAIAIDNLTYADRNIWEFYDEEDLVKASTGAVNDFIHENVNRFSRILDIRIIGLLIVLPFIGKVRVRNYLLTRGYEMTFYALASESTLQFSDADFIKRLGRKLADKVETLN